MILFLFVPVSVIIWSQIIIAIIIGFSIIYLASLRPPIADEAYLKSEGIYHFPEAYPNDSAHLIG